MRAHARTMVVSPRCPTTIKTTRGSPLETCVQPLRLDADDMCPGKEGSPPPVALGTWVRRETRCIHIYIYIFNAGLTHSFTESNTNTQSACV